VEELKVINLKELILSFPGTPGGRGIRLITLINFP
jgi:hypothetical protein